MNTKLLSIILFSFFVHTSVFAQLESYWNSYDGLLRDYVKTKVLEGEPYSLIDYEAWSKDIRHKASVGALLLERPSQMSHEEQLAYWINAYNLLTVDLIIRKGERKSIRNIKNPWKAYFWKIEGRDCSLDSIEHEILRKMDEPRIHFAIVCASLSCPDLRNEAFHSGRLESQLADQTKRFLANKKKGAILQGEKVRVSKIFKWFGEDFGGKLGVFQFVKSRGEFTVAKKLGGYLSYDWSLNDWNRFNQ